MHLQNDNQVLLCALLLLESAIVIVMIVGFQDLYLCTGFGCFGFLLI